MKRKTDEKGCSMVFGCGRPTLAYDYRPELFK